MKLSTVCFLVLMGLLPRLAQALRMERDLLAVSAACEATLQETEDMSGIKVDSEEWAKRKMRIDYFCTPNERRGLRTVGIQSVNVLDSPPPADINFDKPCYARPSDFAAEDWSLLEPADDQGQKISILFDFSFFGTIYPIGSTLWVNNNGNINFGEEQYPFFSAQGFPIDEVAMIAPFWADADTTRSATEPELYGQVWYKHFPQENKFAVIWDKVGYYREQNDKLNTFQVVISDGNDPDMGINQNICFCYLDMQWTTGGASGGVDGFGGFSEEVGPATVGTNKGSEGIFGQYGRFNMPGIEFNGAFGGPSGVDYLDYRGAINASGALCFDNRNPNIPPIASGFPPNNELMIVCGVSVNLTLTFSSPEPQQTVEVTLPPDPPAGMSLTGNEDGKSSVSIDVLWAPTSSQSGTYKLDFVAIDSFEPAAVIELTLTIIVQPCNEPKCCEPIDPTSECPVVGPFCTPWRSPEYCLADESFPLLIRHRTEIVKNSPEEVTAAGYWFHYLNDRGAAYAFTVKEGYRAPELYCCVPTVDEVESVCFEPGNNIPTSFVLRVSNSHSSQGIFVFPFGFGEVELISGMTMTFQDVKNKIDAMPNPGKILVEEFVNGGTTQSPLMPAEYKFHVFNGEIGAVTVIRNRGSDCSCYAEVDADFNRLDIHGCFVPSMPFGKNDDGDTCYDIDKELGQKNPHPIKDLDLCGELDDPKPCAWEDMKAIAMAIGSIIGVYMRIDMFVGADNAVYVQEYTTNHNGGLRHCTAREEDGCLNSCFLGQLWKSKSPEESLKFGGPITTEPLFLSDYISLSPQDQCDVAISSVPNGRPYGPKC